MGPARPFGPKTHAAPPDGKRGGVAIMRGSHPFPLWPSIGYNVCRPVALFGQLTMSYANHHIGSCSLQPFIKPPRISGTAMPHGVFLSTGTNGTASFWGLFATGFSIVALGMISLVPTYVLVWMFEQYLRPLNMPLVALLLQMGGPADPVRWAVARAGVNVLTFFVFLTILRFTSLAGHHAAEHMTVHAIEKHGVFGWEPFVAEMPRAHLRCGSNLLAGILPALLIGMPLLSVNPAISMGIVVLGWLGRHHVGFFLQNNFTTRRPTTAELRHGIEAGQRLLSEWLRNPPGRIPIAHAFWRRGVPQMVVGVMAAMYTLGAIAARLPGLIDW